MAASRSAGVPPAPSEGPPDGPVGLQHDRDRVVARATLLILLIPTLWFQRTDLRLASLAPELFNERTAIRLLFLGILLWGIWQLQSGLTRQRYERVVLTVGVGTAACIITLNGLRPEGSSLSLRTPLMWLLAYYSGLTLPWRWQAIAPIAVSVGLIVLRLTWVTGDATGDVSGDILVILVMNAIGLQLIRNRTSLEVRERTRWEAESEARRALERTVSELRQLRGIIPICSHCKQVRTEVGDWRQIESYVREHTGADFSHGICPSCLELHYGDEPAH